MWDEMHRTILLSLSSRATTCKRTLNVAKVQYKFRVEPSLNLPCYGSIEEKFCMERNMKWKIARMKYGKIVFHSTPYHVLTVE